MSARRLQPNDAASAADGAIVSDVSTTRPTAAAVIERRDGGTERRAAAEGAGAEGRRSGFDRRRGPGRRRTDYRRAAEEGHMNEEQLAFLMAMDEYKRVNRRPFPTLTEVLDVFLYLGYRKVAPLGEFTLTKGRQTPRRGERNEADGDAADDEDSAASPEED